MSDRDRSQTYDAAPFFNTYSRELEEFQPLDPAGRAVKMYTCGPTVYSHAHIGNFRAYIFEDLLQRHLELRGYKVQRVMNLTDVDDKTIRGMSRSQACRWRNSPRHSSKRSSRIWTRCGSNALMNFPPRPKRATSRR